jgi:hypothetical protein
MRAASWGACMEWGTAPPTRHGGGVRALGSRHVVRPVPWSETETARANDQLVVRGRDSSCEAETRRARRRLATWGSSSGKPVGEAHN